MLPLWSFAAAFANRILTLFSMETPSIVPPLNLMKWQFEDEAGIGFQLQIFGQGRGGLSICYLFYCSPFTSLTSSFPSSSLVQYLHNLPLLPPLILSILPAIPSMTNGLGGFAWARLKLRSSFRRQLASVSLYTDPVAKEEIWYRFWPFMDILQVLSSIRGVILIPIGAHDILRDGRNCAQLHIVGCAPILQSFIDTYFYDIIVILQVMGNGPLMYVAKRESKFREQVPIEVVVTNDEVEEYSVLKEGMVEAQCGFRNCQFLNMDLDDIRRENVTLRETNKNKRIGYVA
ncbi:amyloid-beta A4 precursor protein-binding family B member 1-like [Sesbania bispinosa]|nr:amyloid-beta A4 precursor protein-binding family B member 1-like [Sesbania bispinosa]